VTTSMEHNSVLRPLSGLSAAGVSVTLAEGDGNGLVDPKEIEAKLEPGTRLVVATHASNVTGTVNDVATIGAICRERGVPFLVDAAQTAGCVPIDVERMCVDFLAFSGHKGLLGPQGTGGLYVKEEGRLAPLTRGGTGSLSDREDQPEFLPDRFESGTLNVPGIAGLGEGVAWIMRRGIERIMEHDRRLREAFHSAISHEGRIRAFGAVEAERCTGVISVTLQDVSPSRVGELLESRYGILTRIGLHCAPRAHRTIGTFPEGTVRLSWGPFTREGDVRTAARALVEIARRG
jgi:cysteine desulfurase/selenocysteine lyase